MKVVYEEKGRTATLCRGNAESLLRVSWFSEIAVYRLTPAGPNIQHPSLAPSLPVASE